MANLQNEPARPRCAPFTRDQRDAKSAGLPKMRLE